MFKVPEEYEGIVKQFLKGKYSRIDRDYVAENFPKIEIIDGNYYYTNNWKILTQHESLKRYWEAEIDAELPEDAEVWSRPIKNDEIRSFDKFLKENKQLAYEEEYW